jgi:hypothetical protein
VESVLRHTGPRPLIITAAPSTVPLGSHGASFEPKSIPPALFLLALQRGDALVLSHCCFSRYSTTCSLLQSGDGLHIRTAVRGGHALPRDNGGVWPPAHTNMALGPSHSIPHAHTTHTPQTVPVNTAFYSSTHLQGQLALLSLAQNCHHIVKTVIP